MSQRSLRLYRTVAAFTINLQIAWRCCSRRSLQCCHFFFQQVSRNHFYLITHQAPTRATMDLLEQCKSVPTAPKIIFPHLTCHSERRPQQRAIPSIA